MKGTVKSMKRQATDWGGEMQNTSAKGLVFKIYKEFLIFNNKNKTKISKNVRIRYDQTPKENIQMKNKHMKICLTLHIIRELQLKQ